MDKVNKVRRTAKNVLKATNGVVDFVSIEEYIKQHGYIVVLYNTPAGDEVAQRFKVKEKAEQCKAFTLCGLGRIIFIDDNVSAEDKLYLLLHEVGHILLGHLGDGRLCIRSKVFIELEADAMAYAILKSRHRTSIVS